MLYALLALPTVYALRRLPAAEVSVGVGVGEDGSPCLGRSTQKQAKLVVCNDLHHSNDLRHRSTCCGGSVAACRRKQWRAVKQCTLYFVVTRVLSPNFFGFAEADAVVHSTHVFKHMG